MKTKNILLILENHIDKIVLGIIALISICLLWVYIIGNPYGAVVEGRKRSPSQIDRYVKEKADRLYAELGKTANPKRYDQSFLSEYEKMLQCPLSDISDAVVLLPNPGVGQGIIEEDRLYALPVIPPLADVKAASLRGAAQVPTEQVGPDQDYDMVPKELEDVDLITISSRFNVQALTNNFQQSFAGPRLKTSWKDQRLAKPVFARLGLERRPKQENGNWGQWEPVSRTRIDSYQKLLEELPESLNESQFGVDIWLSQYNRQAVQFDILQPDSYSFIMSRTEWMPPEFLDESLAILEKEEKQAQRDRQEQRQRQRSPDRRDTRRTTDRRQTDTRRQTRTRTESPYGPGGMMNPTATRLPERRTAPKERTVEDVKKDMDEELLLEDSDLFALQDPLLVWAHDDTAEPGMTYQYRIRLGVFNPIAGKDWFVQEQAAFKDQIILWSAYSEPTQAIAIPRRVYVFPMEVVAQKDASSQIEAVQVEVTKYQLGRWHDYEFEVFPGQLIGYEVEDLDEQEEDQSMMDDFNPMMGGMGTAGEAEPVDFSTGYTMVDVSRQTIWGSRLRPKRLYQMLYSSTDQSIRQIAIGKSNWDSGTRKVYAKIQEEMQRRVQRRGSGTMPGMPMDNQMFDPFMLMPGMQKP